MSWTRRLAVSTGLAVAAVGIAVPLSLGGGSASAADAPLTQVAALSGLDAGPDSGRGQGHGKGTLPQALKDDLKKAWAAPDGQRVAALQAVLQKAVAGDYGAQVQRRAQRLQQRLAGMDQQLRTDLQQAIDLPKDQRRAALKEIRQKIQAGDYGPQAKREARILRHVRHHRLFG